MDLVKVLIIMGIVLVALVLVGLLITFCYVKAIPTEAVVVTGAGHKEPKFVAGKGVLVLPFIQRADRITMKTMKLDVKTPESGVKTEEGVPLWIDSVVTIRVFQDVSEITNEDIEKSGCKTKDEYIRLRQKSAMANFLGSTESEINNKVNDVLQGNLREIVAEMTVMGVLTKRKEFADRVKENAKPDLEKMGLEIVTFNVQAVEDAIDGCGKKHGVVEAIGAEREAQITKEAEIAKANAKRDIDIAKAEAERVAAEQQAINETKKAEAKTKQELREAELKAESDRAKADAEAAGRIQTELQEKIRREAAADVEIAAQAKEIERAEKAAEVEQRKLDAEIRKKADAAKYSAQQKADADRYTQEQEAAAEKKRRELEAEATLFEEQKKAEAITMSAEADLQAALKRAQAVEAEGKAEAEAIKAKALAEAQGTKERAEALQLYGEAAKLEMMYKVLPEVAKALASVLNGADNVVVYGGGDAASNLMSSMTQGLNQFMRAMADGTGATIDPNALAGAMVGSNLVSSKAEGIAETK